MATAMRCYAAWLSMSETLMNSSSAARVEEAPFTIRLAKLLAAALRERAAADRRSLNKEIVILLGTDT